MQFIFNETLENQNSNETRKYEFCLNQFSIFLSGISSVTQESLAGCERKGAASGAASK